MGHLPTWGAQLPVSYLFAFHIIYGVLAARMLEWFAIPSSSGPCFVRFQIIKLLQILNIVSYAIE